MITIKNVQRKVGVDVVALKRDVAFILKQLHYEDFDIGILIVNDEKMQQYNRDYRGKDMPTDILSFPFYPDLKPGECIPSIHFEEKNLGDLVIDAPYIVRAAGDLGVSFEERLRVLLVHGIYHLLGYDHVTDDDYEVMHKLELEMLELLEKRK